MSSPSTSDSSPSPTASNNANGGGNFMSAAGSPPIILAFLAIGIFSAAMIAVFGWRRVHNPMGDHRWRGRRSFIDTLDFAPILSPVTIGERPPLWETWTDRTGGGGKNTESVGYANWQRIVPLSVASSTANQHQDTLQNQRGNPEFATFIHDMVFRRSHPPSSESNRDRNRSRPQRQGVREFLPPVLFPHIGGGNGAASVPAASATLSPNNNGVHEMNKEIQIAVIIELPSPSTSHHYQNHGRHDPHYETLTNSKSQTSHDEEKKFTNYCIGVHTCALPVSDNSTAMNKSEEGPTAAKVYDVEKMGCR